MSLLIEGLDSLNGKVSFDDVDLPRNNGSFLLEAVVVGDRERKPSILLVTTELEMPSLLPSLSDFFFDRSFGLPFKFPSIDVLLPKCSSLGLLLSE